MHSTLKLLKPHILNLSSLGICLGMNSCAFMQNYLQDMLGEERGLAFEQVVRGPLFSFFLFFCAVVGFFYIFKEQGIHRPGTNVNRFIGICFLALVFLFGTYRMWLWWHYLGRPKPY